MSKFIDRKLSEKGIVNGLSVEDLYAYSKSMMFDYIEDDKNIDKLIKTEALAKKIIEIENNERAYNNYLFILINSGQCEKAFKECKKLLKTGNLKYCALKNLSDKIFFEKGFIDKEMYINILNERLLLSKSEMDKKYVLSIIDKLKDK